MERGPKASGPGAAAVAGDKSANGENQWEGGDEREGDAQAERVVGAAGAGVPGHAGGGERATPGRAEAFADVGLVVVRGEVQCPVQDAGVDVAAAGGGASHEVDGRGRPQA